MSAPFPNLYRSALFRHKTDEWKLVRVNISETAGEGAWQKKRGLMDNNGAINQKITSLNSTIIQSIPLLKAMFNLFFSPLLLSYS